MVNQDTPESKPAEDPRSQVEDRASRKFNRNGIPAPLATFKLV